MTSDDEDGMNMFDEPDGYFKAEAKPTAATHRLRDGREITLHLVGHNPLWVGHSSGHSFPSCKRDGKSLTDIYFVVGPPAMECWQDTGSLSRRACF